MKGRDNVYSLRFNSDELALLKGLTARFGRPISEVIKESLRHMSGYQRRPIVQVDVPAGSKVWITVGEPPSTTTSGGLTLDCLP